MFSGSLDYLARGFSVVPVAPRGKRPLVAWQEFQQRLPLRAEVEAWYARWPEANVAIVTGAISGLVVLDVDRAHGGELGLAELVAGHGALPETVEAISGGGGRHLYFAHPARSSRRIVVKNRTALAPGIDLRGDGGLIVAPPSLHPSGQPYRWRPGHGLDEHPLAPLPRWLYAETARGQALAGHLLWHGVDPQVVAELLLCWNRVRCRPPLSDEEVLRTVASIVRLHAEDEKAGGT